MLDAREPIFGDTFPSAASFRPDGGSLYVFGRSSEPRASHMDIWARGWPPAALIELEEDGDGVTVEARSDGLSDRVSLRSTDQLKLLWKHGYRTVYVDITGLSHHVWAPVIRSAVIEGLEVRVVYVEPGTYTKGAGSTPGQPYDLSARIKGISPLPGLASLVDTASEGIFVPLLGFEGARLAFVLEQVQPNQEYVYPIIGLPGFQPHYVYETYYGNARPLAETEMIERVEYVAADCPFSVVRVLERLATRHSGQPIRIAMIGTKPHALGALLYKLFRNQGAELVYDHPIRRPNRTTGQDRLHVYYVAALNI